MRTQRNKLLAGIAALALLTGMSIASAQDRSKEHAGATKAPQASTQPMKPHALPQSTNKGAAPASGGQAQLNGKAGQGAQPAKAAQSESNGANKVGMAPKATEKHAQDTRRDRNAGRTNARERSDARNAQRSNGMSKHAREESKKRGAATTAKNSGGTTTRLGARDSKGMKGLQANASGVNVKLSQEQRTKVRETVIGARGAPRVGHVDFDVAVGTTIPRGRVHAVRVPETLVRIEPEWRGYLYFVYEDDVIIVNPRNMRIVAVLAV